MIISGIIATGGVPKHRIVPPPYFDSDAEAFFTAAGITDATIKNAVNQLVLDLKAASLWTNRVGLYPMVGGTSSTHAVNLKSPGTFDLSFINSPTHSSNGVDWNGTSQYAATGIIPSTHLTKDAKTLIYYSRDNTQSDGGDIGARDTTSSTFDGLFCRIADGKFYGYLSDLANTSITVADSLGLFIATRISSTQVSFYKNNAAIGTNPKTVSSAATQNTSQIDIGRGNDQYTNRQCAGASVYNGSMSDAQALSEYNAWNTFNTALSRNV